MHRYKIILEYLGTSFAGWQRQARAISVQQILEEAIHRFSGEQVVVHSAGRTDAGVHALGQVAHFDLSKYVDERKIPSAINHFVKPYTVGVVASSLVNDDFHARFSALQRHYMYRIINQPSQIVIEMNKAWWIKHPLDVKSMQDGARFLIGKHDFTSFRATSCQARSALKTLSRLEIVRAEDEIRLYVSAPSFLHHMVRNIVGSLVLVGKHIWLPQEIQSVLGARNRQRAGATAPACGLYFVSVDY